MKKRILEVVGRMDRAGQETFLMNIFRAADKNIYDFTFSVNGKHIGDYEQEIVQLGGKIYHNPYTISIKNIFKHIKVFRKYLRENGPFDVVHCHTYYFGGFIMWAAYKEGVPIRIMHSHNTSDGYKNSLYRILYRQITRNLILKYSTQLVGCGKDAYKSLFKKNVKSEDYILNNAIDINKFDENKIDVAKERKKINCEINDTIFISVARFFPVKNHEKIINIFNEYVNNINHNAKLLLVGDGTLLDNVKKQVNELKLNKKVIFLGKRNDVNKLLLISDLFIMPSLFEGLPVSLIEAQAAGTHCIISDTITDEVDMNIGLITKVSLNSSNLEWAKICHKKLRNKKLTFEYRKEKMEKKGYTVNGVWRKLKKIYDGK